MAVSGKGKHAAAASSSAAAAAKGKRPMTAASTAAAERRKKRRSGVLQFFDTAAVDADEESDWEADEDDILQDKDDVKSDFTSYGKAGIKFPKGSGKSHPLPFLKEEDLSDEELEEILRDRYGRHSEHVVYAEDMMEGEEDSTKRPPIWRVKCMVGKERQMAFSFMQKFVDLQTYGTKLQIISVFSLDHVKGYIYIEADKACDVSEACQGFVHVYSSRVGLVPTNEVSPLLSFRNKVCEVSKDTWVRMKTGKYKGDLAWIVAVDETRKRATIKLVPRVDLQAIAQKFGGGTSLKKAAVPPPRLISSRELENFRTLVETRRDRETGEVFEILDGMMLKDGYLYKKVAISSLIYWGVQPSNAELVRFTEASDDVPDPEVLSWVSSIYEGHKKLPSSEASVEGMPAKQRSDFDLYDLVLFGQKSFGVIVALEKDEFQILKGDAEVPEVVRVMRQEIKSSCDDKMFTASDHHMKMISLSNTVKILEGAYEGRQGVVRHMYKGALFICDVGQEENGGFFCVKSKFCENTEEAKESTRRRPRSSVPQPSTESFDQPDTNNRSFNRQRRSENDQGFSIGETLRIRKGPLKGYLCRVVGIYRSDVTVKVDSLVKVITVQGDLLCPPKSAGLLSESIPSGTFGTEEPQPIGASGSWGTDMPSLERDSWQALSTSAYAKDTDKGKGIGVSDAWGSKAAPKDEAPGTVWGSNAASRSIGDDAWGSKAATKDEAPGAVWGGNAASGSRDDDAWGSKAATNDEAPDAVWGSNAASGSRGDDAWGNKAATKDEAPGAVWGSNVASGSRGDDAWDGAPGAVWGSNVASGSRGDDAWGNKAATKDEAPGSVWGSNAASGSRGDDARGSKATTKDEALGDVWGSKATSGSRGDDAWGSKATTKDEAPSAVLGSNAACGSRGDDAWGSKAATKGAEDAWGSKTGPVAGGADDAWGSKAASETRDKEQTNDPWGSKVISGVQDQKKLDPWGIKATSGATDQEKPGDPWGSKTTCGATDKKKVDDPWGSKATDGATDKKKVDDPWGSKATDGATDKEKLDDPWGSNATSSVPDKKKVTDAWGSNATSGMTDQKRLNDAWGSKATSGAAEKEKPDDPWGSKATSGATESNWNQQRDSDGGGVSTWGRGGVSRGQFGGRGNGEGRGPGGRYGGRGSRDQDDGRGSGWNNSGGGWGSGNGRGGARNGGSWGDADRGRGSGGRNGGRDSRDQDGGRGSSSGRGWGSGRGRGGGSGGCYWGDGDQGGRGRGAGGRYGGRVSNGQDDVPSGWTSGGWGSGGGDAGGGWGSGSGGVGRGGGRGRGRGRFQSSDQSNYCEKTFGKDVDVVGTGWGSANSNSTADVAAASNWNAVKDIDSNKPSGWKRNSAGDDAGKWGGDTCRGDWATQKTSNGGNESSGWNNEAANGWGRPKSTNDPDDGKSRDQAGWDSGRNVSGDQGPGWQGSTSNRGRGSWGAEGCGGRGGRGIGAQRGCGGGATDGSTEDGAGGNGRGSWRGGSQAGDNQKWGGGRGGSWSGGAAVESTPGEGGWGARNQKKSTDGPDSSAVKGTGSWGGQGTGSWGGGDAVKGPSWGEKKTTEASSREGQWLDSSGGVDTGKGSGWEAAASQGGGWGARASDDQGCSGVTDCGQGSAAKGKEAGGGPGSSWGSAAGSWSKGKDCDREWK